MDNSRYEILALPTEQIVLDEFADVAVDQIRGINVVVLDHEELDSPAWSKFVGEKTVSFGLPIPFYERRIVRAKKKAARFITALTAEVN